MLFGSDTWCLRWKETAFLWRTVKAMIRALRGVKLIKKRNSQQLMYSLGLDATLSGVIGASWALWYGHVLRRNSEDVFRRALNFEMVGRRAIDKDVEKASGRTQ